MENSRIIEQNLVLSLPFSLLMRVLLPVAFLNGRVFSILGHATPRILNVKSDHSYRIYFRFLIQNGFLQVKPAMSEIYISLNVNISLTVLRHILIFSP